MHDLAGNAQDPQISVVEKDAQCAGITGQQFNPANGIERVISSGGHAPAESQPVINPDLDEGGLQRLEGHPECRILIGGQGYQISGLNGDC